MVGKAVPEIDWQTLIQQTYAILASSESLASSRAWTAISLAEKLNYKMVAGISILPRFVAVPLTDHAGTRTHLDLVHSAL
jgi:hypothetical protein